MVRSEQFDRFAKHFDDAMRAGLIAAAYAYQRAVKERLMDGYTTGAFSHGGQGVAGTVAVGEVHAQSGDYGVSVGTNVPYAMYWELGHMNLFTRRYERVEVWRETLEAHGIDMESAFRRAFGRVIEGDSTPPDVQFYLSDSPYHGPDPAPGFGGYRSGSGLKRAP